MPKAHNRKRLVVKQRRYERVYKRIADLNVAFCEKGAATEHRKTDSTVPKAHSRKKVVATASRCECECIRTGEPSAPFYEKGGTVKQVTDFFI